MKKQNVVIVVIILLTMATVNGGNLSGDISSVKFDPEEGPYIIEKDIFIPSGTKVSLPAGVVMLFNSFSGLRIDGTLNIMGTNERPVVFSSVNDNEYNSQSGNQPNPFDWNGIIISKDAKKVTMSNFLLRYSVYGIRSQSDAIILQDGIFEFNGHHFTIDDNIKPVNDRVPYSFSSSQQIEIALEMPVTVDVSAENNKPVIKNNNTGRTVLRYISTGLCVAGTASVAASVLRERNLEREMKKTNDLNEWYRLRDKLYSSRRVTSVGTAVGLFGVVSFSFSYAF